MIGIYSKKNGSVSVVRDIKDDLGMGGSFIPMCGACNEKLINIIWPYEIYEFIQDKKRQGQKIDEGIINLMSRVKDDDNPILIIAHLKQ